MPINVSEALDADTAEIVTITRTEPGAYVDGIYVPGSESTFKTLASVQEPTPKQLEVLPEGERTSAVKAVYSKKLLRTASEDDSTLADKLNYKGFSYKIIKIGDWQSYGYTLAFAAREKKL